MNHPKMTVWLGVALLVLAAANHSAWGAQPLSPLMKAPGLGMAARGPLGITVVRSHQSERAASKVGLGPFVGLLSFYGTVISPVDGDRCNMAPTCSLYSRQALEHHGVLLGLLLTAERLLHEGDEIPLAPTLIEGGEKFYLDPLSANTYWWPAWLR